MTIDKKVLYEINMPLGLLQQRHPEIAQALKDSGGPWETYCPEGWMTNHSINPVSALAYRLKRPEPPMTTGEFLTAVVGSVTFKTSTVRTRRALAAWDDGNYDEALRLIGLTPEGGE